MCQVKHELIAGKLYALLLHGDSEKTEIRIRGLIEYKDAVLPV